MKIYSLKFIFFLVATTFYLPVFVYAHQPRIVSGTDTFVTEPEISKAYYGKLSGEPHSFKISTDKKFVLYLNILVPDIEDQKKDLSFAIIKNGNKDNPVAVLDGINFEWKKFWEEFGRDLYWQGPEYRAYVDSGEYEVIVWSSNNDTKYSLAIGGNETVNFQEAINALSLIPKIKQNFFGESPAGFIFSPFGYGYIVIMFTLAGICGFLFRFIRKKVYFRSGAETVLNSSVGVFSDQTAVKKDYFIVFLLAGLGSVLFAVFTTWNPIVLFLSGLAFFEAVFSRYGIYSI